MFVLRLIEENHDELVPRGEIENIFIGRAYKKLMKGHAKDFDEIMKK